MPTKRSQHSRYVIPENLDPAGICCVSIPCPDDPQWRAQLLGAIWRMSLQSHYERDDDKNGKVIAARWRTVYSEVRDGMSQCSPPAVINTTSISQIMRLAMRLEFVENGLNGIAPDRPDEFFNTDTGDAGDEIARREHALCNACYDYVTTMAADMWNIALGTGVTIASIATPILFAINPIASAVAAIATMLITQEVLDAVSDEDNRIQIACCMYEALQGDAVTQANFKLSLTGCGFTPLSQLEIMRDVMEATLDDDGNWYGFVAALGGHFAASTAAVAECICTETFCHTFDFLVDDGGWTNRVADSRPFGVWQSGLGWRSVYGQIAGIWDQRLYLVKEAFSDTLVTSVKWVYETTGVGYGDGRQWLMDLKEGGVRQHLEVWEDYPHPEEFVEEWVGEETIDEIEQLMVADNTSDTCDFVLIKVIVCGIGTDPF